MIEKCLQGSRLARIPQFVSTSIPAERTEHTHTWLILVFLWYFWGCQILKFFGQHNVFFELLQQKQCRIIWKFRQKPNFEPKTCKAPPKVGNRTCPDLPRPVQEGPYGPQPGLGPTQQGLLTDSTQAQTKAAADLAEARAQRAQWASQLQQAEGILSWISQRGQPT